MNGPIWVLAGAPGAGKTTVAGLIAAHLSPPAALLDKDTVYGGFVAATLAAAGRPHGEREGPWYDEHIKAHEYAGLAATTRQIRGNGCGVVLVAPYTQALHDPIAWADLVANLGGDPVTLVWVGADPETLRHRMVDRGSPRDEAKLAAFAAFSERTRPNVPPAVPHLAVDNNRTLAELHDAVARMLIPVGGSV